jgi:hypothetical protein
VHFWVCGDGVECLLNWKEIVGGGSGGLGWEKIKVGWQLSRDIIDILARWLEYEILEAGYDGMYLFGCHKMLRSVYFPRRCKIHGLLSLLCMIRPCRMLNSAPFQCLCLCSMPNARKSNAKLLTIPARLDTTCLFSRALSHSGTATLKTIQSRWCLSSFCFIYFSRHSILPTLQTCPVDQMWIERNSEVFFWPCCLSGTTFQR